ncbi:hypothetical protein SLEP1_g25960 [Rubroshorea leprosula]|uniref:Uncharacterized protein n=1 Tax=Rubroshorea leprosula TaxID=152421 RepID=A0AAV5JKP9_9ROSI|nr:hypothetical protein SLEP1_g25960 [Rubroshorea leprosula]
MGSYMVKHDSLSIKTPFEIFIRGESFDQQRIEEIFNCKHFSPSWTIAKSKGQA